MSAPRIRFAALAGFVVAFAPALANAGGFYVPEIGAKGTGMAGAMTAQAIDSTAIFHNPAGMAGQGGTRVDLSGQMFFPQITFFRAPTDDISGNEIRFDRVENENVVIGAPYLGVMSDVGVRNLAIGIAAYAPFGATIEYPKDGAQRHQVTKSSLRTIYVTPAVAYKLFDRLGLGVGLSYVYSDVELAQVNAVAHLNGDPDNTPDPDPGEEGTSSLEGHDPASFSATFGLRYADPGDQFAIGASVMIPTKLKYEGTGIVENQFLAESDGQPAGRREDDARTEFSTPLILRIGTMLRPHRRVTLAFDVNWQRWSTFDGFTLEFANNYDLLPGVPMEDLVVETNYHDTFSARLGADVTPFEPTRIPLHVRAGVLADQGAVDDRHFDLLIPDSDKLGLTAGLGYVFNVGRRVNLEVDVSYMHLFVKERTVLPKEVRQNSPDDLVEMPGSDKTILNKQASSFFEGVTKTAFDSLGIGVAVHI